MAYATPRQAKRVLDVATSTCFVVAQGALANPNPPQVFAGEADMFSFDHSMLEPTVTLDNAEAWRSGGRPAGLTC